MANAAGHLRSNETHCGSGNAHNYLFGFDGTVTGKHDVTPLGDLATVVCSYDTTAGYSSNSLSSYFHDIGWRDRINYLLHDWLKVSSNQTLGGNYGEATPSDLGFTVTENDISDGSSTTCSVDKDPWPTKYDNTISALTEVELTRRIALHRELPQALRFPGIQWEDIQVYSHPFLYLFLIPFIYPLHASLLAYSLWIRVILAVSRTKMGRNVNRYFYFPSVHETND